MVGRLLVALVTLILSSSAGQESLEAVEEELNVAVMQRLCVELGSMLNCTGVRLPNLIYGQLNFRFVNFEEPDDAGGLSCANVHKLAELSFKVCSPEQLSKIKTRFAKCWVSVKCAKQLLVEPAGNLASYVIVGFVGLVILGVGTGFVAFKLLTKAKERGQSLERLEEEAESDAAPPSLNDSTEVRVNLPLAADYAQAAGEDEEAKEEDILASGGSGDWDEQNVTMFNTPLRSSTPRK
jgi:hypothetical protein